MGRRVRRAALDVTADLGEPSGEPSDDMEAVQHVAGVAQVGVDGGLVGLGAVADDDFDSLAPSVALLHQKRRQRSRTAVLDHRQGAAGVAVDDHGHIAVPFAHRGLIDQQHRAPAAAAMLGHTARPGLDDTVDQMPVRGAGPPPAAS